MFFFKVTNNKRPFCSTLHCESVNSWFRFLDVTNKNWKVLTQLRESTCTFIHEMYPHGTYATRTA